MTFIDSYLFYGIVFMLLSFFQFFKRNWLLQKWYETYNLDQPDSDEDMKRLVVYMQNIALVVSLLGGIFCLIKGLMKI